MSLTQTTAKKIENQKMKKDTFVHIRHKGYSNFILWVNHKLCQLCYVKTLKTAAVTPFMPARWYFRAYALYASLRPPTHAQSICKARRHSVVRNQSVDRPIQPWLRTARLSGTTRVAQSANESASHMTHAAGRVSKQVKETVSLPGISRKRRDWH